MNLPYHLDFYLAAIPAVLLTGISKGGFGGALGGVAVPLMALVISPRDAASIMLPILCLTDWFGIRLYFRKWDSSHLRLLLPGAMLGVAIGALTFGMLSEAAVRLLVGAISTLYVIANWVLPALVQKAAHARPRITGSFAGIASGFTSFVAHAGGPPVVMHLMAQNMEKVAYVATINIFFLITNAVKLLPYAWLGQFSSANLWTSASLIPLIPIGVWTGYWLQQRINHVWFYRIAQIGLLVTGIQLMLEA
ncbi:hypothetical protein SAMN06265795_102579 [Noviherbaspirillum humi]|uniref:Probable membrane transporter protein n=1 Tax=Noviherbaspirillum humi TaxID=1688639 RepID=A0A239E7X7_9BURK|nr:sulfite exporter TauE/SafE family protein [Noviherbaspirillum humi]SNS40835.1 hypothetical protein SAMN06265795_102579 [Noviherbaspirillum humi]